MPDVLATATRHLEIATSEFYVALQRFHLWRVLAYDQRLPDRLGKSWATGGYMAVRSAVFESFLIILTRMFDPGARGKVPLSLKRIAGDLTKNEAKEFIRNKRMEEMLGFPTRLHLVEPLTAADRKRFDSQAADDAEKVRDRTDADFAALTRLARALNKPRIRNTLDRLYRIRNTEVAHRDVEPQATTLERPTYRDLTILFETAAVLIRRMNALGRDLSINYDDFARNAQLRALALTAGLRAETPAERRLIGNEVRQTLSRLKT